MYQFWATVKSFYFVGTTFHGLMMMDMFVEFEDVKIKNKRAHRALGRSPEENVKGQGEAIYRGPLMLSTKYW